MKKIKYDDYLLQSANMNPWYNVFEIEYSLYGHKARVFGFMF